MRYVINFVISLHLILQILKFFFSKTQKCKMQNRCRHTLYRLLRCVYGLVLEQVLACCCQASLVSCVRLLSKKQEATILLDGIVQENDSRAMVGQMRCQAAGRACSEQLLLYCTWCGGRRDRESPRARKKRSSVDSGSLTQISSTRQPGETRRVSERLSQLPLVIGACQVALPRGPRPRRLA